MNDLDLLTDRLHELGRRAPVPAVDPDLDIRRGRTALRRRHARGAAGVTTALVAVGAVASAIPTFDWLGRVGDTATVPAGPAASGAAEPSATATENPCLIHPSDLRIPARVSPSGTSLEIDTSDPAVIARLYPGDRDDPEVMAAQRAYQQAAAELLDPDGTHVDLARTFNVVDGVGSWTCDPATGPRLTGTEIELGWESGDALGVIWASVTQTDEAESVPYEGRWSAYHGQLPGGVTAAQVSEHGADGDAVLVERTDGLTVVVATSGRWDNNMPPGSPIATDLPDVDRLLALAASPRLTFPGR